MRFYRHSSQPLKGTGFSGGEDIKDQVWPSPTLFRYKRFTEHKNKLENFDYIYYMDCDMKFVDEVGEEIFSDIVCTAYHAYFGHRGTPENNPKSLAFISNKINFQYKQNAFLGGSKYCVLNMFQFLANQIDIDYKRGVIACWHDESHANKFYIMYATKVLSPEYCYNPEVPAKEEFAPKIIHIPKNTKELRN